MSEIVKIKFNDFYHNENYSIFIKEYAEECSIEGMTQINPNIDLYNKLESVGILNSYAVYEDKAIIGGFCLLISPNLHYSQNIATIESFFVKKEFRKNGIGLRLLQEAEKIAKEKNAVALFLSTPIDSDLEKVMSSLKSYKETNKVFFKSLK